MFWHVFELLTSYSVYKCVHPLTGFLFFVFYISAMTSEERNKPQKVEFYNFMWSVYLCRPVMSLGNTAKHKRTLSTCCTTTLFSTGAPVCLHWDACSVVITQLGNKQCLPWQKPHSLSGGHKASAVHLFKITPHSSFAVIPETRQKWHACVRACGLVLYSMPSVSEQKTQRWAAGVRSHRTWRSAWSSEKEEPSQAFILDSQRHTL